MIFSENRYTLFRIMLQLTRDGDPKTVSERTSSNSSSESPMVYLVGYIVALISFGVIDALWLSVMGPLLYRPTLGDILLVELRIAPAIAFYLVYPLGVLVLAVLPALKSNSVAAAIGLGVVLGAVCYATYDLTNFATLRNWTLQLTLLDIAYGAILSGLAAALAFWLARAVSGA
jgi:uncharacterized membrane protein